MSTHLSRRFPCRGWSLIQRSWSRVFHGNRSNDLFSGVQSPAFEYIGDERETVMEQVLQGLACASIVCTRRSGPLFVVFGLALIALIVFSYFRYMLPVLYEIEVARTSPIRALGAVTLHLAISMYLLFCVVYCYLLTVCTDPGSPPLARFSEPHEPREPVVFGHESASAGRQLQWPICHRCGRWRPPRTHHCSVCRRCVLHMDHHCIWMNACVGYYNYGFFLSTLYFLVLGAVYTVGTVLFLWVHAPSKARLGGNIWVLYSFVLASCLGLAVAVLLLFHGWILSHGLSTIDYLAGNSVASAVLVAGSVTNHLTKHSSNGIECSTPICRQTRWQGFRENAQALFGHRRPLWYVFICPPQRPRPTDMIAYLRVPPTQVV
jgi:palmitoyltransferase